MALYRLICAFGHQSLVTVLTQCGLALPPYFPGRREAQSLSHREGLPAHDCQRPGALASRLHHGGQCRSFYPVLPGVPTRGARPGADLSRPRHPDRWLRQHHQESAGALPWGTSRELPAPRAQHAPEETCRHHVTCPSGTPRAVSYPVVPGAPAEGLAGVCAGPTVTPLAQFIRVCSWW